MAEYKINVNGKEKSLKADPDTPLLWVLRDKLDLPGTKYGCGIAQCGACTVLLDGKAVRSCSLPISILKEQKITTIEGLSEDLTHPLQEAWREFDVPQCGYCQAGQIMSAAALLKENKSPSEEQIDNHMQGNICRCGTYLRIKKAIQSASKKL